MLDDLTEDMGDGFQMEADFKRREAGVTCDKPPPAVFEAQDKAAPRNPSTKLAAVLMVLMALALIIIVTITVVPMLKKPAGGLPKDNDEVIERLDKLLKKNEGK